MWHVKAHTSIKWDHMVWSKTNLHWECSWEHKQQGNSWNLRHYPSKKTWKLSKINMIKCMTIIWMDLPPYCTTDLWWSCNITGSGKGPTSPAFFLFCFVLFCLSGNTVLITYRKIKYIPIKYNNWWDLYWI